MHDEQFEQAGDDRLGAQGRRLLGRIHQSRLESGSIYGYRKVHDDMRELEPCGAKRVARPYIRTHEGWLYLAVVLDLFSRQVVGWSMQPRVDRELALHALLMAVCRRRPTNGCWCIPTRSASSAATTGSTS